MSKGITPKDALEGIIWRLTSYEDDLELRETDKKEIEIINQALDRSQLLEKENQDLRDKLNSQDLDIWQLHCKYGEYKKVITWLKNTFEITLDSKVRISDGTDCIQAFPIDLKTNEVIYDLLKEILE